MDQYQPRESNFLTTDQEIENYLVFTKYFSDMITRHQINSGEIVYASPSTQGLLNYKPFDLYGQSFFGFIHPDDRQMVINTLRDGTITSGKVHYRLRRKDGDYLWVETTFKKNLENIAGMNGKNDCFCITRDITDIKIIQEDVMESEQKYRTLVEYSHDTISMITPDGYIIYMNESGKRLLGITRTEEVIGRALLSLIHPKDHEKVMQAIGKNKHLAKPIEFDDITLIRTDREKRQAEVKFIPTGSVHFNERRTLQVVIKDTTERKQAEEMLQKAEKLTVVGQLAAGIAHEIRNPLTAIKGFTQLVKDQINPNYAQVILQELDRIETIVSDLLILAKPQAIHTESADLIELIERITLLLNSQAILHNVVIEFIHEDDVLDIECEPDKLKQVFINIIKNAIEAMPEGGNLTIKVVTDNQNVDILFSDEGVGIPKERLEKVGEPFYSTKEKGTGLGMMICHRIIKSHNGTMTIDSEVNVGTTIKVTLPLILEKKTYASECGEW
ncbi:PAS domain S-box protein [Camelliibacillus cellulosilyticus]|uniref:histidine kinase n=1 Tax=Camelliibacillus cellulosilyticus TaxID=2174486 RepID=A0ABV9GK61_9BACL